MLLLSKLKPVKQAADSYWLQLPVIRETEIQLATLLLFSVFKLVHAPGKIRVVRILDLALHTIRNSAIRPDVMKARTALEQHNTCGEACARISRY